MLALIALVILIRGGFQMVTAAGDDAKYKKGFKILQQADCYPRIWKRGKIYFAFSFGYWCSTLDDYDLGRSRTNRRTHRASFGY